MTLESANANLDHSWWGRPSGGREVLRVAAPLVVSSLSWTIMTFVDRMMLNWVSGTAMAAAFTASIAWFAILALPLGICSYANTFVAQYDGARQQERIGAASFGRRSGSRSVWGRCFSFAIPFAPPMFALADHSAGVHRATRCSTFRFCSAVRAGDADRAVRRLVLQRPRTDVGADDRRLAGGAAESGARLLLDFRLLRLSGVGRRRGGVGDRRRHVDQGACVRGCCRCSASIGSASARSPAFAGSIGS